MMWVDPRYNLNGLRDERSGAYVMNPGQNLEIHHLGRDYHRRQQEVAANYNQSVNAHQYGSIISADTTNVSATNLTDNSNSTSILTDNSGIDIQHQSSSIIRIDSIDDEEDPPQNDKETKKGKKSRKNKKDAKTNKDSTSKKDGGSKHHDKSNAVQPPESS